MKTTSSIFTGLLLTLAVSCTSSRITSIQARRSLDGLYAPSESVYREFLLFESGQEEAEMETARWATGRARMRIKDNHYVVMHGTNISAEGSIDIHDNFLLLQIGPKENEWYQPAYVNADERIVVMPGWEWERIGNANHGVQSILVPREPKIQSKED